MNGCISIPKRFFFIVIRRFNLADIPGTVAKGAPDFCSVYVVAKVKIQTMRSASRPAPAMSHSSKHIQVNTKSKLSETNMPLNNHGMSNHGVSLSSQVHGKDSFGSLQYRKGSMDISSPLESFSSDSDGLLTSHATDDGIEAEIRRLKLELKRTMEMHSAAYNRTPTMEKGGRKEIGRGKEKAVFTVAEKEMARRKAAKEAAGARKRIAELSGIRHPNMVLLLGACPEYGCLVYEYMANGSLEDRLFCRAQVQNCSRNSHLLLVFAPDKTRASVSHNISNIRAGTFCYTDPEYQQTGLDRVKSDVYSLGIIFLQILTAWPPVGMTHQVERAIEKGTFAQILDPTMPDWPVEQALSLETLALKCSQLRRKDRLELAKSSNVSVQHLVSSIFSKFAFALQNGASPPLPYSGVSVRNNS
ncbi:hypothetical protein K1719_025459 [Acacia pycnantha]|nr:hypothetical protein K1719_025459 [Acacia pycnantha]